MNGYEQTRKKKKRRRAAASLIIMAVIGLAVYMYVASALQPLNAASTKQQEITIPTGTSIARIGELLEEHNIIKSGTVFEYYVKATYKKGLQAGTYLLSPAMSVEDIVNHMIAGNVYNPVRYKLVIPEGSQLVEIAEMIAAEFQLNKENVMSQLNDGAFIEQLKSTYPELITDTLKDTKIKYPLEGYLFPATYSYHKKSYTLQEIIMPMLDKTNAFINEHKGAMQQKQLTVHELLTMGSLIEEEATAYTDRQKIASVFYNRLEINMPLQTDPTVLYALGKHKDRVLYEDLKVDSPYNTYIIKGLPVGPIANAGEPSLQAALEPAETDYYYFLAAPTGEVFFAKTLAEHNALKAAHITSQQQ